MGQCCESLSVPMPYDPSQQITPFPYQKQTIKSTSNHSAIPTKEGEKSLPSLAAKNQQQLPNIQVKDTAEQAGRSNARLQKLVETQHMQNEKEEQWLKEQELEIEIELENKGFIAAYHQILHLYQVCMHHYRMHEIQNACQIITKIEAKKSEIKDAHKLQESELIIELKAAQQSWKPQSHKVIDHYNEEKLKAIKEELVDANYYQNEMNKAPFILKHNEDGIKISTREEENTIGVMVETELHIPFENIASVLNEINFFTDFLPYCQKSTLVKDCARNSKVGYVILNFPIVAKREAYFEGKAYFRLKTKKDIFLYTRSIHDKPELQKSLGVETPINKDFVQLNYKYFVISYRPLSEGVGNFKFSFNIDNGVHFLPSFIEDLVVREFAKKFFKSLMAISKKFSGSKWERSMLDNPQLFTFIRQSLNSYLQQDNFP